MAMTKAEKAHDTRVLRAAGEVAALIAALPLPVSDDQVLAVMRESQFSGAELCDAFWLMDNEPSRFANHQVWHPRLRSLRNHPDVGEQMFALFAQSNSRGDLVCENCDYDSKGCTGPEMCYRR